jgi:hypothetical protein
MQDRELYRDEERVESAGLSPSASELGRTSRDRVVHDRVVCIGVSESPFSSSWLRTWGGHAETVEGPTGVDPDLWLGVVASHHVLRLGTSSLKDVLVRSSGRDPKAEQAREEEAAKYGQPAELASGPSREMMSSQDLELLLDPHRGELVVSGTSSVLDRRVRSRSAEMGEGSGGGTVSPTQFSPTPAHAVALWLIGLTPCSSSPRVLRERCPPLP